MINSTVEVCQSDELTCDNDGLTWDCIDQDLKCDGVNDCEDGLDEKDCPGKNCDNFIIRTRIKIEYYSNFRKFVLTLFL